MKILAIIDMQNDFITGALANSDAEQIVPKIVDYIKHFDGGIICTQDTHFDDYLDTSEGHNLPIPHCIYKSEGWEINSQILEAVQSRTNNLSLSITKTSFGTLNWPDFLNCISGSDDLEEIILVGTCTDICVVSNALILKALRPETKITVLSNLCAGTTPENHNAALTTMKQCQIDVQ